MVHHVTLAQRRCQVTCCFVVLADEGAVRDHVVKEEVLEHRTIKEEVSSLFTKDSS